MLIKVVRDINIKIWWYQPLELQTQSRTNWRRYYSQEYQLHTYTLALLS